MAILAQKLGMEPAELRLKNFIKPEQFPYHSALGWEYDSGNYQTAMRKMMESVDYAGLRKEQAAQRAAFKRGETREIMGLGVSFFTEIVGAGPSKNCDILGIAMFDSCEIRLHPTGAGVARVGTKRTGQGHETTWAQIIASEIGIPADDIMVEEGDTDTAPYALDDCGTRINPMIIEGQVHGGLTEAFAIAMGQEIRYDETGNVVTGSFMDFFMPTAVETPHWETDFTVTPSPHHPIGAKGVGESPNVGGVPAFSNAGNDAFSFLGRTHIQIPHDFWRNWKAAKKFRVLA